MTRKPSINQRAPTVLLDEIPVERAGVETVDLWCGLHLDSFLSVQAAQRAVGAHDWGKDAAGPRDVRTSFTMDTKCSPKNNGAAKNTTYIIL